MTIRKVKPYFGYFIVFAGLAVLLAYAVYIFENTSDKSYVNKKPAPENLNIWAWENTTDAPFATIFKKVVNDFNKSNKYNVKASLTIMKNEQYKTSIATSIASNNVPDVFMTWPSEYLKTFVNVKKIYSLNNEFKKNPSWKNRYVKGIFNLVTFNKNIYAVPISLSVTPLYYNRKIFASLGLKVPTTYEELKNVIRVLVKHNITPIAFGSKQPWEGALLSEIIAERIGGSKPFYDIESGKGTWQNETYYKAFNVMKELVDMHAFPKNFNSIDYDPSMDLFKHGKAAMVVMGTWAGAGFSDKDSLVKGKIGIAKFPTFEGGKGDVDTWLGNPDPCVVISQGCKNKTAAAYFLQMLSEEKYQMEFAEETGSMPAVNIKLDPKKVNPLIIETIKLTSKMKSMFVAYDVGLNSPMGEEYNETVQAVLAGESPVQALARLQELCNQAN